MKEIVLRESALKNTLFNALFPVGLITILFLYKYYILSAILVIPSILWLYRRYKTLLIAKPRLILTAENVITKYRTIPLKNVEHFQFIKLRGTGITGNYDILKLKLKNSDLASKVSLNELNQSISHTKKNIRTFLKNIKITEMEEVDKSRQFTNYNEL